SSEAYWHIGAVVNEIGQLVEQAWALIKADAGRQALTVLEAITEEYMSEWENLDDSDGEASGFFSDLGTAWTEAILSADLTREEREQWADQFAAWQEELETMAWMKRLMRLRQRLSTAGIIPHSSVCCRVQLLSKVPGTVKLPIAPMSLPGPTFISWSGEGDSRSTCTWLRRKGIPRNMSPCWCAWGGLKKLSLMGGTIWQLLMKR